jgi:hypothetical protein
VSFWRYKLLELIVGILTFPLAVLAFFLWGWLFTQFANPTSGGAAFFLFGWLFVFNKITKRAERWWIARHQNVGEGADEVVRR